MCPLKVPQRLLASRSCCGVVMRRIGTFLLGLTLAIQSAAAAHAGSWIPKGPPGTDIVSLAVDPINPDVVYASTVDEVFKSTDGGRSWIRASAGIPIFEQATQSFAGYRLAIDPITPSTIYGATHVGALVRSSDAAATWILDDNVLPYGTFDLTVWNNSFLGGLLAASEGGLWRPASVFVGGPSPVTFVGPNGPIAFNPIAGLVVTSVASDPKTGVVYAGTSLGGQFRGAAAYFGGDLRQVSGPFIESRFTEGAPIAIDPENSDVVYISSSDSNGDPAVCKSVDSGHTWNCGAPFSRIPGTGSRVQFLTVDPLNPRT